MTAYDFLITTNNRRPALLHRCLLNLLHLSAGRECTIAVYNTGEPLVPKTAELVRSKSVLYLQDATPAPFTGLRYEELLAATSSPYFFLLDDDMVLSWNTFEVLDLTEKFDVVQPYLVDPEGFVLIKGLSNYTFKTGRYKRELLQKARLRSGDGSALGPWDFQFLACLDLKYRCSWLFAPLYVLHLGYATGIGWDNSVLSHTGPGWLIPEEEYRRRHEWMLEARRRNSHERVSFHAFPQLFSEPDEGAVEPHLFGLTAQRCPLCDLPLVVCSAGHRGCPDCWTGFEGCGEVRRAAPWPPPPAGYSVPVGGGCWGLPVHAHRRWAGAQGYNIDDLTKEAALAR